MLSRLRSLKQLCVIVLQETYVQQNGEPDWIYCDASHIAVGSHFVQWDSDGGEILISFVSSQLLGVKLSWAAVEKEAYAVIRALKSSELGSLVLISQFFPTLIHSLFSNLVSRKPPSWRVRRLLCRSMILLWSIREEDKIQLLITFLDLYNSCMGDDRSRRLVC